MYQYLRFNLLNTQQLRVKVKNNLSAGFLLKFHHFIYCKWEIECEIGKPNYKIMKIILLKKLFLYKLK